MEHIMRENIGTPAMLEQMAEEAAELSKACLKMSRILRNENPTPITFDEAKQSLLEEYTDVVQCAEELDLTIDRKQMIIKRARFIKRLLDSKESLKTTAGDEL